jgi:putative tryptophan/tyrosine transport system substrate-binding protein
LTASERDAAAVFNPNTAPYYVQFLRSAEVAGQKLGVEVFPAPIQNDADIEKTFVILNRTGAGGILQIPDSFALQRRQVLVSLAEKYRVPVIYAYRSIPSLGGLMAYAVDTPFLFGRAAEYVDRLLKGAKPQDLPVQQPTKFEFIVNLKTAKTLGLAVPQSLLVAADELIE